MPGRSPGEAFEAFHQPLRVAAACLDQTVQWASAGDRQLGGVVQASLNFAKPVVLQVSDERRLGLISTISVEVVEDADNGPYRVTTREAIHELVDLSENPDKGDRLVAWHYHPGGPGVTYPHLHLPKSLRNADTWQIARSHVPTGRVAFEDIVLYLIDELKVSATRSSYRSQLIESRDLHIQHRTW